MISAMKKDYQKPTVNVVELHLRTMLLMGSNDGWEVIPPGDANWPAG
jgi:hypothetical protein